VPTNPAGLGLQNEKGKVLQAAHSLGSGTIDVEELGGGGSFGQPPSPSKLTSGILQPHNYFQDVLSGEGGAVEGGDSHFGDAVLHNSQHGWLPDAEGSVITTPDAAAAISLGSGEASV